MSRFLIARAMAQGYKGKILLSVVRTYGGFVRSGHSGAEALQETCKVWKLRK